MSWGCLNARWETEDRFLYEVRVKPFFHRPIWSTFSEGGSSILLPIAMVVTSYRKHSTVRKIFASWSSRNCSWESLLRLSWISMPPTFGARYFVKLLQASTVLTILLDYGIVLDSACASDFYLVCSRSVHFWRDANWRSFFLVSTNRWKENGLHSLVMRPARSLFRFKWPVVWLSIDF